MPSSDRLHHLLAGLLWLEAALLAAAAAGVILWSARLRATVGPARVVVRARRWPQRAMLALAALAAVLVALERDRVPAAPAGIALGLAALLAIASPGFQDSCYGESGVQRGWFARRFQELEEWRLIGDHLRWRLFGEWVSSDVPAALHPELRSKLEQLCPGRESPHGAGQGRPDYA